MANGAVCEGIVIMKAEDDGCAVCNGSGKADAMVVTIDGGGSGCGCAGLAIEVRLVDGNNVGDIAAPDGTEVSGNEVTYVWD